MLQTGLTYWLYNGWQLSNGQLDLTDDFDDYNDYIGEMKTADMLTSQIGNILVLYCGVPDPPCLSRIMLICR